jgi:hypothetical protein
MMDTTSFLIGVLAGVLVLVIGFAFGAAFIWTWVYLKFKKLI